MHAHGNAYVGSSLLLIEDDAQTVGILEPILIAKGFTVQVARDGLEGLEKARLLHPDIILLDLNLPRMSGFDVCQTLKEDPACRFIPIIVITGLSDLESKLKALDAGADDFLNKPYNSVELLTRVKSLLRIKLLNDQLDCAEDVLFSMARAIEAKDSYTQGHVERVSHLAVRLGEHLGLSADEKDSIYKGGILHDIGKIGVPDKILNKAGPLTTEERLIIRMHPGQGAKICEKLKSIRGAIPVIRHHHERMDGSGYPDKLKGNEIPLVARVMTVVDIYDALTTTRSYRKSLPRELALEIMWEEAKKGWWDQHVLHEFVTMLQLQEPAATHSDTVSLS